MVSRIITLFICVVTVQIVCGRNVLNSKDEVVYYDPATGLPVPEEFVTSLDSHNSNATNRPGLATIGDNGLTCECVGFSCSCCAGIKIDAINLDQKVCSRVFFQLKDLAIQMSLLWNEKEIYSKQVSILDPQLMCTSPPGIPSVTFCVRLNEVTLKKSKLRVCLDMETEVLGKSILMLHFKCMEINGGCIRWYPGEYTDALSSKPGTAGIVVSDQYEVSFYEPQTGIPFLGELMSTTDYYDGNLMGQPGLPTYGFNGLSCKCKDFDCSCCAGIRIAAINLDKKACLKFTYLPTDIGIKMSLLWNENEIYSKQVSAHDPPAVCLSVPRVPLTKICIRFSDVSITKNFLRACIDFEIKIASKRIAKLHFKCVELGSKGFYGSTATCPYAVSSQRGSEQIEDIDSVVLYQVDLEPLPVNVPHTTIVA